jgi:hypothetical protein
LQSKELAAGRDAKLVGCGGSLSVPKKRVSKLATDRIETAFWRGAANKERILRGCGNGRPDIGGYRLIRESNAPIILMGVFADMHSR